MKIFTRKFVLVLVLTAVMMFLASCNSNDRYYKYSINLDPTFQSPNSVDFWVWNEDDKTKFEGLVIELNDELKRLDNIFNIQDRGDGVITDLMKVNSNAGIAPVLVDREIIDVLNMAIEVSDETLVDGVAVYDVTIAPVWQLWDFPNKSFVPMEGNYYDPPSKAKIEELLPLVDYNLIQIDEEASTVFLPIKGMGIDLGSIVKGYAADKLKTILINHGIKKAVIDVGRNILLLGNYFDRLDGFIDIPFSASIITPYVSIFHPKYDEIGTFGNLKIDDNTLVTSGSYEKYIKDEDDNEYHHILDPRTGYPFNHNVISISVVTEESIKGDAYSTALFSLGLEKGMELVESKEGLDAIWVVKNEDKYEVYISSGLEGNFEFNSKVEERDFVYKGVYK